MSSDPTKLDPITAFAAANRKGFAAVVLAVAVLCGAVAAYGFSVGLSGLKADAPAKPDDPAKPPEDAAKKETKANPWEALSVGVCGAIAALGLGAIGFGHLAGFEKPTEAGRRVDARATILFAGGTLGLALILLGVALFVCRIPALTNWLSLGKTKQMAPVLTAVAVALVGAVVAFLSLAPARAEERANPTLRRLVYGANAVLWLVSLAGVLFAANVLIAVKAPGKLDTTESGIYSLDPKTVDYVNGLDQKVNMTYITLDGGDSRYSSDTARLLEMLAFANPAKITQRTLNAVDHVKEIKSLIGKYPTAPIQQGEGGILITLGEDETRFAFVPGRELFTGPQRGPEVFEGEGRIVRELLFLADNKQKTVVYVTQGSGELAIVPAARSSRTMRAVVEKLTQINCDVRPLVIDAKTPAVPADAGVVVVADPTSPMPKETLAALMAYANPMPPPGAPGTPNPAAKKGKLLVMSGAFPNPDGKTLAASGLDELLASFGVVLGQEQIYSEPPRDLTIQVAIMEVDPSSSSAVVKDFAGRPMYLPYARTVTVATTPAPGTPRAETLFTTKAGTRTFLDGPNPIEAGRTWQELPGSPALRAAKKLSTEPRPVAVSVPDGTKPQALIFGSGLIFSDQYMRQLGVESPIDLFAALIDTLRERPAVASLATKTYGTYTPPPEEKFTQMFWLPVLLIPLVVAAAGVGVWVVRRK
jgi:hypothetical protein